MADKKVRQLKRWSAHNKAFILMFAFVLLIAYLDTVQIQTMFSLPEGTISQLKWDLYNQYTLPAWIALWIGAIALPALMYYFLTKDKSESIGLFGAGFIMIFTGLEDVFYFMFSWQPMTQCMQWLNDLNAPVAYYSQYILKEACVSPFALTTFAAIGLVTAYFVFKYLREKW